MVLNTEWAQVEVIDLVNDGHGLAFGITGGKSSGVVVKTILPGGVADRDGRLQSGDHILQIGDVNLRGLGSEQVAAVLRQCGVHVRMVVARTVESASADIGTFSHAPLVPTKFLGDPVELDRYLIENGYEGAFCPAPAPTAITYPDYGFVTAELHLQNIPDLVDVVKDPLPIGIVPTEPATKDKPLPAAQVVPDSPLDGLNYNDDVIHCPNSDDDMPESEIFTVRLARDDLGLGITVAGYVSENAYISGIYVKSISKGSAADLCKKIQVDDKIIEVDGTPLTGYSNHQAVQKLKHTGKMVTFKIERYLRGPNYHKLQLAIVNNELMPPSPPSPTVSSLPKVPLSVVHMSHLGIEADDVSRTSFDFDSAVLHSPTLEEREIYILRESTRTPDSVYEKWRDRFSDDIQIILAQVIKEDNGLGITLEGTVDVVNGKEVKPHHYIRNILPEGPVGLNGVLRPGDELLEVNNVQLLGLDHVEVVSILKHLPSIAVLVCARYPVSVIFKVIETSQDPEAFQARSILAGSLQHLIQPREQNLLVKAKSEISIASSSIRNEEENNKSKSLEQISELPMWSEESIVVQLIKGEHGLGFSILDYEDPLDPEKTVIVVRSVIPGGVAQSDGRIVPGDRLLSVNCINLRDATLNEAVRTLKGLPKGPVRVVIAKPISNNEESASTISQESTQDSTTCIEEFQECMEDFEDYLHISIDDDRSFNHSPCSSQNEIFENSNNVPNHIITTNVDKKHFLDQDHSINNHFFGENRPLFPTNHLLGDHNHFLKETFISEKEILLNDSLCDSDTENSFKSTSEYFLDKNYSEDFFLNKNTPNVSINTINNDIQLESHENIETTYFDTTYNETSKSRDDVEEKYLKSSNFDTNRYAGIQKSQSLRYKPKVPTEDMMRVRRHTIEIISNEDLTPTNCKENQSIAKEVPQSLIEAKPKLIPVGVQVNLPVIASKPCMNAKFMQCCQHICLDSRLDHITPLDGGSSEEDEFFLIEYPVEKSHDVKKSISEPNVLETYTIPVPYKSVRYKLKEYYNDYDRCLLDDRVQENDSNKSENNMEHQTVTELSNSEIFNDIFLPFKSNSVPDVTDKSFVTLTYDPGSDLENKRQSVFIGATTNQLKSEMTVIYHTETDLGNMKDPQNNQLQNHWGSTHMVRVYKEPQKSLGISIVGGKVDVDSSEKKAEAVLGIFVKNVVPNSPAGRTGLLKTGDRILEVSGIDVRYASHSKAVEVIKNAPNPVVFLIQSLVPWESTENVKSSTQICQSTPPSTKKIIENHNDSINDRDYNEIKSEHKRKDSAKVTFGQSTKKPNSKVEVPDKESRPVTPRTPTPVERERIDSGSEEEEEEDDEEDRTELEGRTVSSKGQQIDRASAANVKRSKDEAATDPEEEDDFGYTTNKVKKKYGNLGQSVLMVQLERGHHGGLGLSLAGHKDRNCMAVFVCGLNPNGVAFKAGSIEIGDEILEVNGVVLHGRCHLNAAAIIKSLSGPVFKVIILRRKAALDDIAVKPITQFPVSLAEETSEEFFSAQYPNVRTVAVKKPSNQSLGIMIIEGKHAEVGQGIFISDIQEGSSAEKAGLEIGEMILAVNKDSLIGANYDQAAGLLKRTEGLVTLVVSSPSKSKDANRASSPQVNNIAASNHAGLKPPLGPSRSTTPEPPPDPLTCTIIPGKEITIEINSDNKTLGVFFVGGKDTVSGEGIVLSDILPGGAVEKDGRLQPGDQILEVNGVSLRDASNTTASQALRQTLPKMKLLVYRPTRVEYTPVEIDITKKPGKGLGLSLMPRRSQKGVFVSDIISGGLAEADGRIAIGDIIVSVNGTSVESATAEEAGIFLKTAQGKVSLKINRYKISKDK